MSIRLALHALILPVLLAPVLARAQWQPDGVPLSAAVYNQFDPLIVSDGSGGAIVIWSDTRSHTNFDIYARRVDASGVPKWAVDGVPVSTAAFDQTFPTAVADGSGGVIVAWHDSRASSLDIYAQRVDAFGAVHWATDGVALCSDTLAQQYPKIVSDGAGGAIVTWEDHRGGIGNTDIYAQRVDALGTAQWTANGVALCTAANDQSRPEIVADGSGGAVVIWIDLRSGSNIYAQRVDASGAAQWTANGVAVCIDANDLTGPVIVTDGLGGTIVAWSEERGSVSDIDIYAQRLDASGVGQWTTNGVPICTASNRQANPMMVTDGLGGAIVVWNDARSGQSNNADIYAQRADASGVVQWAVDGVAICTDANNQTGATIVSDGSGGGIVTWYDYRAGLHTEADIDIYAQRVDASGVARWTAGGVTICTAPRAQYYPVPVADGLGGAVVAWQDYRHGFYADIYAHYVTDPANAVAIASFEATESEGVVTLRSRFRSDLGVEAVNVYRAAGIDDGPLITIERVDDVQSDRFEYVDRNVAPGQSYRYRIGVVDADGEFFSPIVTLSVAAINGELLQNQPNPFNPTTAIRFVLPVRENVALVIYDAHGRLVRSLLDEVRGHGAHEVTWDGRDDDGVAMGSGVYFYRLRAGKFTESRKMVLLK